MNCQFIRRLTRVKYEALVPVLIPRSVSFSSLEKSHPCTWHLIPQIGNELGAADFPLAKLQRLSTLLARNEADVLACLWLADLCTVLRGSTHHLLCVSTCWP